MKKLSFMFVFVLLTSTEAHCMLTNKVKSVVSTKQHIPKKITKRVIKLRKKLRNKPDLRKFMDGYKLKITGYNDNISGINLLLSFEKKSDANGCTIL